MVPQPEPASMRVELLALWRLAGPVIIAQVAMMAMGVVDIAMVGGLGAQTLAAVGLGNTFVFGLLVAAMGVLTALDPLVAQAIGAGRMEAAGRTLRAGYLLAIFLALPVCLGAWFARPVLALLRQPLDLLPLTEVYVRWTIPGILPMLVFHAQRQGVQATGVVRPVLIVALGANVFNFVADWALIYGHLGAPPLGVQGAGLATSLSRILLGGGLVALCWQLPISRAARATTHGTRAAMVKVLVVGAPIGLMFGLEVWAFTASGLVMGILGELPLAAHVVALNMASLAFMLPLGISSAAAVRVGQAIGRGDAIGARRAAFVSVASGAGVMTLSATAFALFPEPLALCYTRDPAVVGLIVILLPIAALFQLVDGLQVVASGALRGAADTRVAAACNFFGYYAVALPLGWWLAFHGGWGPRGPWIGLAVGLALVASLLLIRLTALMRTPPAPIEA